MNATPEAPRQGRRREFALKSPRGRPCKSQDRVTFQLADTFYWLTAELSVKGSLLSFLLS